MADQKKASELAGRGLDLWGEGRLREAADCLREAILLANPGHYNLSDYHGSLGGVLSQLGEDEAALAELNQALDITIMEYATDASPAVSVARYFLAEHLLKMRREADALACLAPSLGVPATTEGILRSVEARCLWSLGRKSEAKIAAHRAIETARSDQQRENISKCLRETLADQSGHDQ